MCTRREEHLNIKREGEKNTSMSRQIQPGAISDCMNENNKCRETFNCLGDHSGIECSPRGSSLRAERESRSKEAGRRNELHSRRGARPLMKQAVQLAKEVRMMIAWRERELPGLLSGG